MDTPAHLLIKNHWNQKLKGVHLRQLLEDEERNKSFVSETEGVYFDYTHEKLDTQTLDLFDKLAREAHIFEKIEAMFKGQKINSTENRAVLHVALRSKPEDVIELDGENVVDQVHKILHRIQKFTDSVRSGEIKGYSGKDFKNVVVIGIGGSYLSLEFVYEALRTHSTALKNSNGKQIRFLANVDPVDFIRATQGLNVEETLFVVNSKTFTTAETMMNAHCCRQWIIDQYRLLGQQEDEKALLNAHLCAVSTNLIETNKFGIQDEKVFGFWDWVGGRYSVCSAIGMLPLSLHFGFAYMVDFLRGANHIDKHFLKTKEVRKNIPLLLGIITWYRTSIQERQTIALIPYSQSLVRFPAHIQQLSMESNGKQSLLYPEQKDRFLEPSDAVIFGEPGTNSQHSFFQLLHQGKYIIPCEFIGYAKSQAEEVLASNDTQRKQIRDQHDELMSNFFAQVDALAKGKNAQEVKAEGVKDVLVEHKVFPGDRNSVQILFKDEPNPFNVGQLLAIYEHRVAVTGFLFNINSFDQWGVELGKVLAKTVKQVLVKNDNPENPINFDGFDGNTATKNLMQKYREYQRK